MPQSEIQHQLRERLNSQIGRETHVSDWREITQERIQRFAEATDDYQWIHLDEARAQRDSPYGGTIAHGYLTLALYPWLRGIVDTEKPLYPGVAQVINYGVNKVRFPAAVASGARIRGRTELLEVKDIPGGLETLERFTIDIDEGEKPACVAEVIMRLYF